MATIYLSALLNAIKGRLGDVTYGKIRGIDFVRLEPASRRKPDTARARQIRRNFGTLSTAFTSLSDAQKQLWHANAQLSDLRAPDNTGYIRLNGNLLNASHQDLVAQDQPPSTPSTPKFPKHFAATAVTTTKTCLTWTIPNNLNTYVTGHFRLHYAFCNNFPCYGLCPCTGYQRAPRFVGTERSDLLHIIHNHTWPTSARLYYWLNSIDKHGRKSPRTHELMITVP